MSHLEMIRFVRECYPDYGGQLYVNFTDCCKIFGLSSRQMREHISQHGISFYRPAKAKLYNVLEVLDSIQGTKNDPRRESPA